MLAQTIGKYRISRTIGTGAYGTVLEATDSVLDRTVALKVLRCGDASIADFNIHMREAQALARLRHPNIVTIFDLGREGNQTFLAMEYIEGETLATRLRQGALTLDVALTMARDLADALAAAHQAGVIHADVKPGNVILDRQSRPLLVDFGLARLSRAKDVHDTAGPGTGTGDSIGRGTLCYMAPELYMGGQPDYRSDIFALGAMLFEMVSGRRAFAADNDGAVMQRIINGHFEDLSIHCPDLPPALVDLIARMLDPDPYKRPASMAAIRDALDAHRRGQTSALPVRGWDGPRVGPRAGRWGWVRRHWRWPAVAAGLCGIVLAAAFAAVEFSLPPDRATGSIQSMLAQAMDRLDHFEDRGAIDNAISGFQDVLARDPQNAAATAGLSLALMRRYTAQQPDPATLRQADATARLALALDSQLALAHIAVAWAETYANNKPAAYQAFDAAQSLDKGNVLTFEGLARLYRMDGRLDDAIATLRRGIEQHPDWRILHDDLGRIYFDRANYIGAEAEFRRSIALAPDSAYGYANLSAAQHMQGQTTDAIKTIQMGLRIRPHPVLYINLGSYLYFLGQYQQAADAFESLTRLDGQGQDYLSWENLGDAYRWIPGKEEEARTAYRMALRYLDEKLKLAPRDPTWNVRAALYHAKLGEKASAEAALAIALAAPTAEILFKAAIAAEILERRDDALALLSKARKAGYAHNEINQEPELAKLRQDRRYQQSLIEG